MIKIWLTQRQRYVYIYIHCLIFLNLVPCASIADSARVSSFGVVVSVHVGSMILTRLLAMIALVTTATSAAKAVCALNVWKLWNVVGAALGTRLAKLQNAEAPRPNERQLLLSVGIANVG